MGDQNHRDPLGPVQIMYGPDHLFAPVRIQHGGRLVKDNALRLHGHHARNRHPLLLSPGQTVGRTLAVHGHPHLLKAFIHPPPDLLCRDADIFRAKAHVLLHHISDNLVVRVLKYHPRRLSDLPQSLLIRCVEIGNPDCPLCREQNPVQMLGQRRFAGTVMSQHSVNSPFYLLDPVFFIALYIIIYKIYCFNNVHRRSLLPLVLC